MEGYPLILYEGVVTSKNYKGTLQLILTSQKIIFEKEKGLLKKESELIDILPLEIVKVYNDAVQVKQKGDTVEVQTVDKNIAIVFSGILEARKFTGKMVDAVTTLEEVKTTNLGTLFELTYRIVMRSAMDEKKNLLEKKL